MKVSNLAELNFGIIKQDSEIAEYIRMVSDKTGYPKSIYFYSDKKFTENAREVIRALGSLNRDGLIFSLQSDTPEALSAVKRKNISDKDIEDGILFAANENIPVATEMIFGLPYDTKESMIRLLNKVVLQGFDSVLLHNLFLTDGVELNRKYFRDKYGFKTKYRLLGSNYSEINSTVIAEVEEVLVESEFFDFGDYLSIRSLNVMFFAVYQGGFYKYFFRYISELGIPVASFFDMFMNPNWSGENNYHVRFVNKFKDRASSELHNNNKDVYIVAKNLFDINNDVGDPVRLNPLYYSLLMYDEESWVSESFRRCLIELKVDITDRELKLADNLLSVCSNMIVDLMDVDACQQESFVEYNLVAWEKEKFLKSIYKYKLSEKSRVAYYLEDVQRNKILSFCSNNRLNKKDFLYTAVETIFPRSDLFYKIKVVL